MQYYAMCIVIMLAGGFATLGWPNHKRIVRFGLLICGAGAGAAITLAVKGG